MTFLERIIASRRGDIAKVSNAAEMRRAAEATRRAPHRLRAALPASEINIIGEFKRASPSLGSINQDADLAATVRTYETAGACAISILTEPTFFRGSLEDLRQARALTDLPILRKDFVVGEYQIDEAALAGADAILLIVAALSDDELGRFRARAEDELGLDALVEVHTAEEMERAAACGAKLIGVNNRDLRTFQTSLATSQDLAPLAPPDAILVSESGLASPLDVARLARRGYSGFLVGESLMRSADPAALLNSLRGVSTAIKVCGITNEVDARLCGQLGVQMVGLNFSPESPRCVSPQEARDIIAAVRPQFPVLRFVGVFVNQELEPGLDAVQLHGDESPQYVRNLRAPFVIKALRVGNGFSSETADAYDCDAILLDSFSSTARGGTGERFDWTAARALESKTRRLILAGGLTPGNVAEAIETVRPFAVDVCSGVEITPGRKDAEKLRRFVGAVR